MKKFFIAGMVVVFACMACGVAAMAEEDASVGIGVAVEGYGDDMWGDPMDETEESEFDGGLGRGEPDADAIEAAGGDGTGEYD